MKRGYLVLQDGQVFQGYRFGADGDTVGELVFTTGMCGYIETLTDPSYAGQIVLQTYPLMGNYGIIREDFEGACCVRGYVVREWCEAPSNFRCDCDMDTYLKEQGVPGLWGVDTRELTRIIREHGVMNAAICDEVPADLTVVKTYAVTGVVEAVSCAAPSIHPAAGEERFRVSLIDYGAKRNIVRELQKRGCTVTVVPATVSAEEAGQRPRRSGGEHLSNPADSDASGQGAHVRHLPGPPADGPGRGRQHLQTQIRPPGREPAGPGFGGEEDLHHQPEPRLRCGLRQREGGHRPLRQRQRRHLRGHRLPGIEGLYGPVPSGGLHRPQGYRVFV